MTKWSMSTLHLKGVMILTLWLSAESVTFANIVSFWKVVNSRHSHRAQGSESGASGASPNAQGDREDSASCLSTPSSSATRNLLSARALGSRNRDTSTQTKARELTYDANFCCNECAQCTTATQAQHCLDVLRGGHQTHGHASAASMDANLFTSTVGTDTPYGLPLHVWKVLFQLFLTSMNVFCWLVPLKSKKISQNKFALSMANAFSGGVFLSLAFGHLIPECVHGFSAVTESSHWLPAETPFVLVLCGYLLIFFVEKVAFDAHDILHEMQEEEEDHAHHNQNHPGHSHRPTATKPVQKQNGTTPAEKVASTSRSAVILLGALAVHSVLEMMALGLADSFADCALLTLSISLHQPAESIALLVAFLKSGLTEGQVLMYLSIFSCMGPIGVALGMAVNEFAAPIVDSIMLAIVAGTFVYVGATEVIPEEWESSRHKWQKFAALMTGIVGVLAITQYTAQFHSH